jgi:hypothetical protein
MARQEGSCWRCGSEWAVDETPRPALQLFAGAVPLHVTGVGAPVIAVVAAGGGQAVADAPRS